LTLTRRKKNIISGKKKGDPRHARRKSSPLSRKRKTGRLGQAPREDFSAPEKGGDRFPCCYLQEKGSFSFCLTIGNEGRTPGGPPAKDRNSKAKGKVRKGDMLRRFLISKNIESNERRKIEGCRTLAGWKGRIYPWRKKKKGLSPEGKKTKRLDQLPWQKGAAKYGRKPRERGRLHRRIELQVH